MCIQYIASLQLLTRIDTKESRETAPFSFSELKQLLSQLKLINVLCVHSITHSESWGLSDLGSSGEGYLEEGVGSHSPHDLDFW